MGTNRLESVQQVDGKDTAAERKTGSADAAFLQKRKLAFLSNDFNMDKDWFLQEKSKLSIYPYTIQYYHAILWKNWTKAILRKGGEKKKYIYIFNGARIPHHNMPFECHHRLMTQCNIPKSWLKLTNDLNRLSCIPLWIQVLSFQ